ATWLRDWNFPNAAVPMVRRIMDDPPDTQKLAERDKNIKEIGYVPSKDYIEETYNIEVEDREPETDPGTGAPADVELAELGGEEWSIEDALSPEEWRRLAEPMVRPLLDLADRPDADVGDLAAAYEEMDIHALTQRLARALFVASVWGRLTAERDDSGPAFADDPDIDLGYATQLPPRRAVDYFTQRGYEITWDWHEMWQADHARAFTVAKAARLDVLSEIREAVETALTEGQTFRAFARGLAPKLRKLGWWGVHDGVQLGSWRRLRTIFQTNMLVSYSAAHYRSMTANADSRPYWQYNQIQRESKRDGHALLHLKVFRHNDPIWDVFFPPNGWFCGCWIRALTASQVEAMGVTVASSDGRLREVQRRVATNRRTGKDIVRPTTEYQTVGPDGEPATVAPAPEWAYNPGKARSGTMPPDALGGLNRLLERQPSWSQLGLPAVLPRSRARVSRRERPDEPLTTDEARAQIRDALSSAGAARIAITRDDGRSDAVFRRVGAPGDLEPVMVTEQFVEHIATDRASRRERFADYILPSLRDPSEVWLAATVRRDTGRVVYRRRFLTSFADRDMMVLVQEDTHGWLTWTMYPDRDINRERRGYLLYRRPDSADD
ncbi:MAG: DUF935 family protein, partial [Rhodospirillales bacterium]|nr:DUF935 family protein [Rhodospirillales bacterium]